MEKYDILIIGGGTAGATAAYILQNHGFKCMIVDNELQFKSFKIGESLISSAKPILEKAGLMPWVMKSFPQENLGNLSAWGSHQLVSRDYIYSPHGTGWHLDRALFDQCLRDAAKSAGVIFQNGYVKTVLKSDGLWFAQTKNIKIKATLIIDASGRHSFMSKQLNIPRYKGNSLISIYSHGKNVSKERRTLVETVPYGWWYTASIPGDRRVAALHIRPNDLKSLLKVKTDWENLISATKYIRNFYEPGDIWSRLKGTDASSVTQQDVSGEKWIAIGDAALAFDPISSQGIFNAIYTAWKASALIKASFLSQVTTFDAYSNEIKNIENFYKNSEIEFYSQEKRWLDSNFWKKVSNSEAP